MLGRKNPALMFFEITGKDIVSKIEKLGLYPKEMLIEHVWRDMYMKAAPNVIVRKEGMGGKGINDGTIVWTNNGVTECWVVNESKRSGNIGKYAFLQSLFYVFQNNTSENPKYPPDKFGGVYLTNNTRFIWIRPDSFDHGSFKELFTRYKDTCPSHFSRVSKGTYPDLDDWLSDNFNPCIFGEISDIRLDLIMKDTLSFVQGKDLDSGRNITENGCL